MKYKFPFSALISALATAVMGLYRSYRNHIGASRIVKEFLALSYIYLTGVP